MPLDMIASVIPFFFIAAIVYGALEVSDVFKNRNVKTVIAAVFAFFTITYEPLAVLINQILPYAAMFFIALFFLAFLFKPFRGGGKRERDYSLIIIIGGLVLIFLANSGYRIIQDMLPEMSNSNFMVGAGLVIILMIFYAAYKKT